VVSFAQLDIFHLKKDSLYSNGSHFFQAWSELYRSSYNPRQKSIEDFRIIKNSKSNIIDIGIINASFNQLDFGDEESPNIKIADGQFSIVEGRNAIAENVVSLASLIRETIFDQYITLKLNVGNIFQNNSNTINSLTIEILHSNEMIGLIENGIILNKTIHLDLKDLKKLELKFHFELKNGDKFYTQSNTKVSLPVVRGGEEECLNENFFGNAGINHSTVGNMAFQGYNESSPQKGIIEYRTYYNKMTNSCGQPRKINKPLIILDGYDPGDKRKLYNGQVGYNSGNSSLYDEMKYDPDDNPLTDNSLSLVEKLRNAPYGFDVTLVNFPIGADYIERNAMALVSLLQRENQKLVVNGSTNKIKIIGPSMGGLISRYALAYMEKNNLEHNTDLWVSFDSPHLGANIPVSSQETIYFFGYTGDSEQTKEQFFENFASPAARQMLIEQLDGLHQNYTISQNPNLWGVNGQNNNSPFRNQFSSNLSNNGLPNSNGYPQNLRKISIVNGTNTGVKINQEGQMYNEMAAFKRFLGAKIKVAFMVNRFLNHPNQQIRSFEGRITKPGFLGFTMIDTWQDRINQNPKGSMDVVQGGTFNTQGIIKQGMEEELEELDANGDISFYEWRAYKPFHSFIPTASSLAFKNPNFNWGNSFNRNLVCNPSDAEIPFDSYFVPHTNEDHVDLTNKSVQWLIKELNGNPQLPIYPLSSNDLVGPNFICVNQTVNYSFGDICRVPSNASWLTSNLEIVSSNSHSIVVRGIAQGMGVIIANFQNGDQVRKEIWVGAPNFNSMTEIEANLEPYISPISPDPYYNCSPIGLEIKFWPLNQNILEYQWEKITQDVYWNRDFDNPNNNRVIIFPTCNKPFEFRVRARNLCGWSEWMELSYNMNSCNHACPPPFNGIVGNNFILSPNPVHSGNLNISIKPNAPWFAHLVGDNNNGNIGIHPDPIGGNQGIWPEIRVNISIFNQSGIQVANFTNIVMPANLNISHLITGTYLVRIQYEFNEESYTIIKH
jgi:hypothetical protein